MLVPSNIPWDYQCQVILFLILRNSQKQSPKIKVYRYTILSKGKHWRGVHQEPHQEKAGGTMKTAST